VPIICGSPVWLVGSAVHQVEQYQLGVVFRFGRVLPQLRDPGLCFIVPVADKIVKVTMQTVVLGVPAQVPSPVTT
jgi:regulator of protease activity HflC (stomatin/prohibitin superfamily)